MDSLVLIIDGRRHHLPPKDLKQIRCLSVSEMIEELGIGRCLSRKVDGRRYNDVVANDPVKKYRKFEFITALDPHYD